MAFENMYNIWVGASEEFKTELVAKLFTDPPTDAVSFPLLNSLDGDTVATLTGVFDLGGVQRLFKEYSANSRIYKIWSFYAIRPANVQDVKDDFDALEAAYPQDFAIMGMWRCWDGQQVASYAPDPLLSNFMPDEWDDGLGQYVANPTLRDINLLAGQAPRSFS